MLPSAFVTESNSIAHSPLYFSRTYFNHLYVKPHNIKRICKYLYKLKNGVKFIFK